jgi:hypothetical protein
MKLLFSSRGEQFSNNALKKSTNILALKYTNYVTPLATHDMKVHFWKDKQHKAQDSTATHATLIQLKRKSEGQDHKLYMDNFFSSADLFDDLTKKK